MKRHRVTWVLMLALMLWLFGMNVGAQEGGSARVGEHVILDAGQIHSGDLVLLGGSIEMLAGSRLSGDLLVIGGSAEIAGEVTGSVSVIGGTLSLLQGALVRGDTVVAGTLRYRHSDAVVLGNLLEGAGASTKWGQMSADWPGWMLPNWSMGAGQEVPRASGRWSGVGSLIFVLLAVAVSALAMTVVPENVANTREIMTSSAPLAVGIGLLTLLVCIVLVPLLVMICIGIPVAAVLVIALVVCFALAWVAVGQLVGACLLKGLKVSQGVMIETLVGVLLVSVLAGIPCLGPFAALLAASWGIGAVVLSRFGTRIDPIWTLAKTEPVVGDVATQSEAMREPSEGQAVAEASPDSGGDTHELDLEKLDDLERHAEDALDRLD